MNNYFDFGSNKGFRLLNIYERLNKGEEIVKESLANEFGVSNKTIQRDIDDLRAYIAETHIDELDTSIRYDKSKNCYYLVRLEREWMTNEEALAMCKILLESRAFNKNELTQLIEKLIMQISPADRHIAQQIIKSELFNYIPLQHNQALLTPIWELSKYITEQRVISFNYTRQDGRKTEKIVKPVSIMFNEFYFYLIAYARDIENGYPVIFRIDRMENVEATNEHFEIPYRDKFSDGEFRKRVLFMYTGELEKVTFEYSGVLEAMLDKVPTAKVIKQSGNTYTMQAEAYGKGLEMWLNSQGDKVKIIE